MNCRINVVLWLVGAAIALSASCPVVGGELTDIVEIDTLPKDSGYKKIWQPYIAKWSDEHYVAAYGLQLHGKGDMGDMLCSISKDRGKTWSAPTMIFDHRIPNGSVRYAYNNAVLFRPPGQDILWCFAMRTPMHFRDSEDARLCAAYSGDGGYSWTHVELAMDYHGPLITCADIVPVKDELGTRYLLPVHRNTIRRDPTGDRQQFVLESRSLLRWKLAGAIPIDEQQPAWIHEGNIAEGDKPGELKMVTRTGAYNRGEPRPGLAFSSVSRDGGRTWSTAKPEADLPNFQSKAFYGKDSLGRHVYVYSDNPDREGLYYKVKPAGGTWSEAKLFFGGNTRNSYPTLIEDRPGEWLCVWDSSNDINVRRSVIRFGRLKLAE